MRLPFLYLFLILFLFACHPKEDSVLSKISLEEYESLMAMTEDEFDQTPNEGWRKYQGEFALQIKLIQDYLERNQSSNQTMVWHIGQLYGMLGEYDQAIPYFERCVRPVQDQDIYRIAWNYYVHGTIAFMRRDEARLDLYIDSLQNHDETMNIEVLMRLKNGFSKSYKEAYSGS